MHGPWRGKRGIADINAKGCTAGVLTPPHGLWERQGMAA